MMTALDVKQLEKVSTKLRNKQANKESKLNSVVPIVFGEDKTTLERARDEIDAMEKMIKCIFNYAIERSGMHTGAVRNLVQAIYYQKLGASSSSTPASETSIDIDAVISSLSGMHIDEDDDDM